MLKRLHKRFLMWVLAPALDPRGVDELQASIYAASASPKSIAAEADSGAWTLDPKGTFVLRTKL